MVSTRLAGAEIDVAIDALLAELRGRTAPFQWVGAAVGRTCRPRGPAGGARARRRGRLVVPPPVTGLEIRRVADDADFAAHLEVMGPILSPSDAFTTFFADAARRLGFAPDAAEEHFLGLVDGVPVATSSLLLAGGAAGIYNVTTVEAARGRGIGAAMTAAAVRAGAERGMRVSTLQASDMGRPVYERLGFTFACDFVPYRVPRIP